MLSVHSEDCCLSLAFSVALIDTSFLSDRLCMAAPAVKRSPAEPGGGTGAVGPRGPPGWPQLLALVFVLDGGGGVVVQSLGHEVQGQAVLDARGFLDLGTLVLEPDLDLRLV